MRRGEGAGGRRRGGGVGVRGRRRLRGNRRWRMGKNYPGLRWDIRGGGCECPRVGMLRFLTRDARIYSACDVFKL